MKKKILLLLLLCSTAYGQWTGLKPFMGQQINWGHSPVNGLVGCWMMNEGTGNLVNDLSGNGNTGILVADTHFVPGKFGSALGFNGTSDYINLGSNVSLRPESMSYVIWLKLNDHADFGGLISGDINNAYTYGFNALITNAEAINFYTRTGGSTNYFNAAVPALTVGLWTQITLTYDGITKSAYKNGILIGTNASATGPLEWGAISNIWIGKSLLSTAGKYFSGQIDHAMIYNRALTAYEVQQLYSEPFCMSSPSFDLMLYSAISVGVRVSQFILISN